MNTLHQEYWRKNVKIIAILLVAWFLVSFGCGILFSEYLDQFYLGGFKLGFWFAQQGSIFGFVLIIMVYVVWMNKLDHEFDVDEDDIIEAQINSEELRKGGH